MKILIIPTEDEMDGWTRTTLDNLSDLECKYLGAALKPEVIEIMRSMLQTWAEEHEPTWDTAELPPNEVLKEMMRPFHRYTIRGTLRIFAEMGKDA